MLSPGHVIPGRAAVSQSLRHDAATRQALAEGLLPLEAMHRWKADCTTATQRGGDRRVLQQPSAQW